MHYGNLVYLLIGVFSIVERFERWEPDERRRSRPVLRERGGVIPLRYSTSFVLMEVTTCVKRKQR